MSLTPFLSTFSVPFGTPPRKPYMGPGIPVEGCPLEDHPDYSLINNLQGGPSHTCWDEFGKVIILEINDTDPDVQNIAYRPNNYKSTAAIIETDYLINPSGDRNWALPIAGFIDANNLIGVRLNNDQIQIVQRFTGTWTTLATAPAQTGHYKVLINSVNITVNIDGVDVLSTTHDVSGEKYFGLSMHRWPQVKTPVLGKFSVQLLNEQQSPCMTSDTTPIGVASASSYYDQSKYPAWFGLNCRTQDAYDAWMSPTSGIENAWLDWRATPDEIQPMVPTRFEIKPRSRMPAPSWYHDNNPQNITFYGVRADGTLVELFNKALADWDSEEIRSWDLPGGTEAFYGFRLLVNSTNKSEAGGDFHVCIGWLKVWGTPIEEEVPDNVVTINGEPIRYKGEYVTHT